MGRIDDRFAILKKNGRKAFVVYLTAGDPDLNVTEDMIIALDAAGADIIEVGVPFSDPTADGPTIQAASERALKNGINPDDIFAAIASVRKKSRIPIILFGYYNPVLSYGKDKFAAAAAASGVDGILVVDLPPEEADELRTCTDPAGLSFITLVAPTTDPERSTKILRGAAGFIYYISVTGVTGTAAPKMDDIREDINRLKEYTDLPIVVGFGISTPEQAAAAAKSADGVVVGSAIVRLIGENPKDPVPAVVSFAGEIRRAIDAS